MIADAAGGRGGAGLAPGDSSRVLVVDDEQSICRLFSMILLADLPQCRVDTAENGRQAVSRFETCHHAVLLMDLHMPIMDGWSAFTAVEDACRRRNWQMPAVVFCSGFAPPDTVQRVIREPSPHCLLIKPVMPNELVEAVRGRLRR